MARYKEYDRNEVLEKSVNLFWRKGYKSTSMADVVQTTGLNTASMYKEFGDKDGLFEETLEHYRQYIVPRRFQSLIDEPNFTGIEKFIQALVTSTSADEYKGCLLMNHLVQKPSISLAAAHKVDDFCVMIEALLETALRNAQANKDISANRDPAALASFILCCVQGLIMFGQRSNNKDKIPDLREIILGAL
ncbi:MAG: TetR/AcrR family transcriptional regulator [Sneathiella sp.]